jgi:hypothetical protein
MPTLCGRNKNLKKTKYAASKRNFDSKARLFLQHRKN